MNKNLSLLKEITKNKVLYLMMMPGALLVFFFAYMPMPGVLFAFKDFKYHGNILQSFTKSEWVGFDNFKFLFKSPNAFTITRNTILYNLVFIFVGLVISVALAIALNEIRNKTLSKFFQTTFILPYFLSWVIVAYFAYSFLSIDNGIINKHILKALGMEPVEWYFDPKYWPFIIIPLNLWKYAGFNAIVYMASLSGIDPEYYEAAQIDGASKWQQIKNITIPMLRPLMVILTILAVGKIFNSEFGLFYSVPMQMRNLGSTTEVIDTYVYRILMTGDMNSALSAGLYQAFVGFILVMVTNTIVKKIDKGYALF